MNQSQHPLNLGLRFILELVGLFALGYWGWTQHTGIGQVLLGIGLPVLAAALWGSFRDPRDHGKGLVAVPGAVRLLLEAVYFSGAVLALAAAHQPTAAAILAGVVALHYAFSLDRLRLMLSPR